MNLTIEKVLNVSNHSSDLSLLPVTDDLDWLIELPEQWSWLPLWLPGKIPRKYIQLVAIGSSFAMPASTLDFDGIMASTPWDTTSRSAPSATNKQPTLAEPLPVANLG